MSGYENQYLKLVAFHAVLAVVVYSVPALSNIYGLSVLLLGILYVIKNQNRNNEVLMMAAYLMGIDVFLKMTGGGILNEFGKYTVIVFMVLGMFYKGFAKGSFIYLFFLILLIPGIYMATTELSLTTDVRKAIAFNITGPACLGISAVYCYKREISFERLQQVVSMLCLPLVSTLVYLFVYNPSIRDVVTSTQSNFETSGGFGPNQVSTVLGLGLFSAFALLLFSSKSKLVMVVNAILVLLFAYRGIVTFSRGGVYTAVAMIVLLLIVLYFKLNTQGKSKLILIAVIAGFASTAIWTYSSLQTGGLIDKRYANEDAAGRKKETTLSGREKLIETELKMFTENPVLGIGVGRNKEYRQQETGIAAASHNELTRMMAEHGSLGIAGLLILFFTPLVIFFNDKKNIYALSFLIFWLMTINHAAMRIAAPAFMYALALLKVQFAANPVEKGTDEPEASPVH